MSRNKFLPLVIIFFAMCKNADKKIQDQKSDNLTANNSIAKDSCITLFPDLKTENCKLIKFCDKVLDGKSGEIVVRKIQEDNSRINFNTRNVKFYDINKDTLSFLVYFLGSPTLFFYPTKIYINKDTLHFNLGYKGDILYTHDELHCFQFEIALRKGVNISAIMHEVK